MRSFLAFFHRRPGHKGGNSKHRINGKDTDLSDFNMFMDAGEDRQDTDLNEISEHLKFVSGGASSLKRRL